MWLFGVRCLHLVLGATSPGGTSHLFSHLADHVVVKYGNFALIYALKDGKCKVVLLKW
jgi:hypothetical protein